MTWMSWRQFRLQALVGALLLVLAGVYLLSLGLEIRDAYDTYLARCGGQDDCAPQLANFLSDYQNTLLFVAAGFGLVPAFIGAFWGAPLIARELETGTHRLAWNQSVTRRRWLVTKLGIVGLGSAIVAALLSLLLTWAANPLDGVAGDRFSTIVFGARNLAPVGYTVFAFVAGAVIGLLVRRTLPAMALTFLAVIVMQFAVPNLVRTHYMPPEATTMAMTADAINQARSLGSITGAPVVGGLTVPDAWVTSVSELRTADGQALPDDAFNECFSNPERTGATGTFGDTAVCLGDLDLHVDVAYQPNDRYWPFQWIELTLYIGLSALVAALGLWRIRRHAS
jgi:hypothetical protein